MFVLDSRGEKQQWEMREKTWRRSTEKELKSIHPTLGEIRNLARSLRLERDCEGLMRPMAQ